jgi:hypothetical protein
MKFKKKYRIASIIVFQKSSRATTNSKLLKSVFKKWAVMLIKHSLDYKINRPNTKKQ